MVTIQGYQFEDYALDNTNFNDVPGVYVIYTNDVWLDVGETDKLGSRIAGHNRQDCWRINAHEKTIYLAFIRISDSQRRLQIEQELRSKLGPSCGER